MRHTEFKYFLRSCPVAIQGCSSVFFSHLSLFILPLYTSLPFPSSDRVSLIWVPLTSGNSAFPELSAPFTTPSPVARHCSPYLNSYWYNFKVTACSRRLYCTFCMSGHFNLKQKWVLCSSVRIPINDHHMTLVLSSCV